MATILDSRPQDLLLRMFLGNKTTFSFNFSLDLTGCTARLTIRSTATAAGYLIQKTVVEGDMAINASSPSTSFPVVITEADQTDIESGRYWWELDIIFADATTRTFAAGAIEISKTTSAAPSGNAINLSVNNATVSIAVAGTFTPLLTPTLVKNSYESNDDTNAFTDAEKTKLAGIAAGAEVNVNADWNAESGDAQILNKPTIPDELADLTDDATHRTVTDTEKSTWNGKQDALGFTPADAALIGANSGIAELDENGFVPTAQLPSYVDDVIEAANFAALPGTGETGKIYVTLDDGKTFRWSGSAYAEVSASIALGETSATAYRGDRGKTAYDHSQLVTGNPHAVTKSDVGLGNVDNTSDANKPVSTAMQAALDAIPTTFTTVGFDSSCDYVCDGAADQVQINAALDAMEALGGGKVFLKRGTYTLTGSILVPSNMILEGEGDGTVLERGVAGEWAFFGQKTAAASGGNNNIIIRNLKIDDKKATYVGWSPVYFANSEYLVFENIHVINAYWHSIEVNDCRHVAVRDCLSEDSRMSAYQIDRNDPLISTYDILFERCVALRAGEEGFEFHKNGVCGVTIRDCYVEDCLQAGVCVSDDAPTTYTNDSEDIHILNNVFRNCSTGVVFETRTKRSSIVGNRILGYTNGITGIDIDGTTTVRDTSGILVSGNYVECGYDYTISAGGSGYSDATNVAVTGGGGSGATVDITTTAGVVTGVTVNKCGTTYADGNVLTISGGGGNATITINQVARYGITVDNCKHVNIIDNNVKIGFGGAGAAGISAFFSDRIVIERNRINGSSLYGVRIDGSATENSTYVVIAHNLFERIMGGGVEADYSKNIHIHSNVIHNPGGRAINVTFGIAGGKSIIANNSIIIDGGDYGIVTDSTDGVLIEGNSIIAVNSTANKDGISISSTSKNIVQNNTISGMSRAGIQVWGGSAPTENQIVGNTITGCAYGIYQSNASAVNTIIERNNCYSNTTLNYSLAVGTYKRIRANIGYETNKSGTATLLNGNTSIVVTHGLSRTPAAGDIMVTPMETLGGAAKFWINTYTSTQFTINVDADPGADVDFAWKAILL